MMTPEEHRAEADRIAAEVGAMQIDSNPVLLHTMAELALTHALLATPPPSPLILEPATLESTTQQPTWAGVAVLIVVFSFLLAVTWVIFQ